MMDCLSEIASIRTYVINLDRADERLASMTNSLADVGLQFERISAVDGNELKLPLPEFDERGYRIIHGRQPNAREIGCYLSHVDCARRLLASECEFALILEDDLQLDADFREILVAAIRARRCWDLLRLSSVSSGRKFGFAKLYNGRELAIALTREKGSGAYLINRRAAHWVVDRLMPMRLPFDLAFDMEFGSGIKAVFVSPLPANQQTGSPSQIQAERRRQYHLSHWRHTSVLPFRIVSETRRLFARLPRLIIWRAIALLSSQKDKGFSCDENGRWSGLTGELDGRT